MVPGGRQTLLGMTDINDACLPSVRKPRRMGAVNFGPASAGGTRHLLWVHSVACSSNTNFGARPPSGEAAAPLPRHAGLLPAATHCRCHYR